MSHAGVVVWLCGVPASGKTTLAGLLVEALRGRGLPVLWLDSDDLRQVMTPKPTYSDDERETFYRTLAHLAKLSADAGLVAVLSATASRRAFRDRVRAAVPRFVEVWITCDPAEVRRRDPKGLYADAAAGTVQNLPGHDAAFEPPEADAVVLESDRAPPDVLLRDLLRALAARGVLPGG